MSLRAKSEYLELNLEKRSRNWRQDAFEGLTFPTKHLTNFSWFIQSLVHCFSCIVTQDGKEALLKLSKGDMRRALNVLQVSFFPTLFYRSVFFHLKSFHLFSSTFFSLSSLISNFSSFQLSLVFHLQSLSCSFPGLCSCLRHDRRGCSLQLHWKSSS